MAKIQVEIKGLDKLNKKILAVTPALKAGIKGATRHIKGVAATYPPETLANKRKTYNSKAGWGNFWYQRGWGQKWALADGDWHGHQRSEVMGKQWNTEFKNGGLTSVVGNPVSYAPYVQGPEGVQVKALKNIGWKGIDTIAEEEKDTVTKFIQDKVDRALG